jgi:hypothetical protein
MLTAPVMAKHWYVPFSSGFCLAINGYVPSIFQQGLFKGMLGGLVHCEMILGRMLVLRSGFDHHLHCEIMFDRKKRSRDKQVEVRWIDVG